jgi:hypothetical protein
VNIRPHDLVRLRRTPEWIALVMVTDDAVELALVEHWVSGRLSSTGFPGVCCMAWLPIALLELVPGQFERLAA